MLFQKFYNYIKYKTLPPSLLFKNRLFIERNSQKYRILTNFGLTFRSAKWSVFTKNNLKPSFIKNFNKILAIFCIFVIGVFFCLYAQNIQFFNFFNNLCFLFWVNVDLFDYYSSFVIWFCYFFFSSLANYLYSYFFFNNFFNTQSVFTNNAQIEHNSRSLITSKIFNKPLLIQKTSLNWNLTLWLSQTKLINRQKQIVESLFEITASDQFWKAYAGSLPAYFKIVYFINFLGQTGSDIDSLTRSLRTNSKYEIGTISNEEPALIKHELFFANIASALSFFTAPQVSQNNANYGWSSQFVISTNGGFDDFLLTNKLGFFFLTNTSYEALNLTTAAAPYLFSLSAELINFGKLNKWLYKYSLLNRKLFKNSFKLTTGKRTLRSNVTTTDVFNKNLWNTHFFSNTENFQYFIENSKPILSKTLSTRFESNLNFLNQNVFNNFAALESSYFWLIKRFFFFSNLSTNRFFSTIKLNNPLITTKNANGIEFTDSRFNEQLQLNILNNFFFLKQMGIAPLSSFTIDSNAFKLFPHLNNQPISILRDVNANMSNDEFSNLALLQKWYIFFNFEITTNFAQFHNNAKIVNFSNCSANVFSTENDDMLQGNEVTNALLQNCCEIGLYTYQNDLYFFFIKLNEICNSKL